MSTYIEIQNRVNDDYINRSGFTEQTKRAIKASIRYYETRRTIFNETATLVAASIGQAYVVVPTNMISLDDFRITVNSQDLPLTARSIDWIRDANIARSQGQPSDYAIYQNRIQLHAIPDTAYAFPLHYIKRLNELSADADTNTWITGTWEDVITYRAAYLMWANVIRNDTEAAKFKSQEIDALARATGHLEQFRTTTLRATRF